MPDTQQVQVKMPDGKMWTIPAQNLDKAKARGAVVVQPHGDFVKGFTKSMGLSSPDLSWSQIGKETWENTKKSVADQITELRKSVGEENAAPIVGTPFTDVLAVPHLIARGAEGLASGLETAGRDILTPGKRAYGAGEGLGAGSQVALGMEGSRKLGNAVSGVKESVGRGAETAAREFLGIDEDTIAKARTEHDAKLADLSKEYEEKVQKVGAKTTADEAAYQTKVEQAKDEYSKKVAEHTQKTIERSAKESGAKVKANTLTQTPRSGPVYQRLSAMADSAAQSVSKLDKTVREAYNARWNAWRHAMGDAQGNFTPVQDAVVNAEDNILKGSPENIAIFRNILKEGEDPLLSQASVFRGASRGVDVKDVLSSMKSEGERTRFLNSLREDPNFENAGRDVPKEGATLPIDQIQGYSTELGNKIYKSASISGDVRRALKSVKDAADKEVERVAVEKGQGSVYRQLKRDWAQYMDDFYDHDGPLYKMKNAVNSDRRIALISGGEGPRVIDSLGHYSRFDPNIETVGRVRSLVKQLRELPSSSGTAPAGVARPTLPSRPAPRALPERPEMPAFNVPEFVQKAVEKRAQQIGTTGHALIAYWIIRDLMHGKMPSPGLLATPVVQHYIMRYLKSPKFIQRVQGMVQ